MTHRAESIMVAVLDKIDNLTTTGTRVERGRVYPVDPDAGPALTLEMGPDVVVLQNIAFIDRELTVHIIAHVKLTSSTEHETVLNTIREEVHIALRADYTQGLDYIKDTIPEGDDEPEASGDADKPTARQRMNWRIRYRHSVTNPGA